MQRFRLVISACAILVGAGGCSSIFDAHSQKQELMRTYDSGDLESARIAAMSRADSRRNTGDAVMWSLEAATIAFDAGGHYQESLREFTFAEELIREYERRAAISLRDAGAEVGSAVVNPNALPYRGFYYDRVMLSVYKALNHFADSNPDGALVELRRMRDTQRLIAREFAAELDRNQRELRKEQEKINSEGRRLSGDNKDEAEISTDALLRNPTVNSALTEAQWRAGRSYGNLLNPFAVYMSAIGYLYEQNMGEALVAFRNLYRMNPANPLTNRDYVTAARTLSDPLPPVLAALTGTAAVVPPPLGRSSRENMPFSQNRIRPWPYSMTNNIVFVIFANGRGPALKQTKFELILPWVGYTGIAFPQYQFYPAAYRRMDISGGGQTVFTETVADMDAIAAREYMDRLPLMITRIVINYLTKELASLAATQAAQQANTAVWLTAYGATGLYKYLFNTADTRCWETLPKEFQVAHLPIPADRRLELVPQYVSGNSGQSISIELKKQSSFVIVYVRAGSTGVIATKVCEF